MGKLLHGGSWCYAASFVSSGNPRRCGTPTSTTPPSLFSRAKDAVKFVNKGIGFLGKATPLLYAAQPLEANAGEEDALAKLRLIDGLNLTGQELQLARDLAMSPKVSYDKFVSKYFPASTAVASAPPPLALADPVFLVLVGLTYLHLSHVLLLILQKNKKTI